MRRPGTCLLTGVLCVSTGVVHGHALPGLGHDSLWTAWSPQLWLWLLCLLPGALTLVGIARLWRQAGSGSGLRPWQAGAFVAGWVTLGLSILSPLDALGGELFWAHMLQHEVMMLVAAPLLVLGKPLAGLVWGLPAAWRPGAARLARGLGLQSAMRYLTRPLTAWLLHVVVLWGWHAPMLFVAAVERQWVHDLQHASFLLSALLFWWAVFQGCVHGRQGMAVFYLFTTAVHTSVLGALLTFSTRLWYPVYAQTAPAWGLTALEDQQLGGLIMWVPGGVVFLVAALALLAVWIRPAPSARSAALDTR